MTRKLRILFVLDALPGIGAGTEGQFWLLLRNLDRNRFEPSILLLRRSAFLDENVRDVPVQVLDISSLRSPRALWRLLRAAVWARRSHIDIAHIFFNDSSVAFPLPLKLAGLRVIVSRRDLGFWYTPGILKLLRFNRHFVDAVVANCRAVGERVREAEGYPPGKIRVIYNGLARSAAAQWTREGARQRLGIPVDARVLTVVANLRPLKRIDDAIRALALVRERHPNAILLVVGEDRPHEGGDSLRVRLESLAESLGVGAAVRFLGALADPTPAMVSADVCLLNSETEGLSNSVIEYMAAARPVVCTNVGGNPELVTDGVNGFVVDPGDVDACARRIESLLSSTELAERMGRAGAERVAREFSPQASVAAHAVLYQELVSGREASTGGVAKCSDGLDRCGTRRIG